MSTTTIVILTIGCSLLIITYLFIGFVYLSLVAMSTGHYLHKLPKRILGAPIFIILAWPVLLIIDLCKSIADN